MEVMVTTSDGGDGYNLRWRWWLQPQMEVVVTTSDGGGG